MRSENARLSEVLFTIPVALLSEENIYRRVARAIHLDLPARDGFERTCSRDFKDAQMTRAHICTVFTLFSYCFHGCTNPLLMPRPNACVFGTDHQSRCCRDPFFEKEHHLGADML